MIHHNMGAVMKWSFHTSGICREAFTSEYAERRGKADRKLHRWLRSAINRDIPLHASRVAQIGIPTDFLSDLTEPLPPSTYVVPAAIPSYATVIELVFTYASESEIKNALAMSTEQQLVLFQSIPGDLNFFVHWYHASFENSLQRVQRDLGHSDLIISKFDPRRTGRPIRITVKRSPNDGDHAEITEFGAYPEQV